MPSLQVSPRDRTGKGAARALRREGKIPGVIYGHNREPEALEMDAPVLGRLLGSLTSASAIVDIEIAGRAPVKALIREIQRNPVRPADIIHVDLYEVQAHETLTAEVRVRLTGTADGVRNFGGVLDQVLHELEIECLPGNLPDRIELDVTPLGIGDSLFVRDVQLPNIEILNDPGLPICSVVAPRVEETTVVAEPVEAPASGEPELIRKPKPEGEAPEAK